MARAARDPEFVRLQYADLRAPHMAPITDYVDSLRSDGRWLPYVAPLHAGANARMVTVLSDPGPRTLEDSGSGMLCVENDDQTAETQCELMAQAGLTPAHFLPWNAYPWYINRAPNASELRQGAEALHGLLALLPDVVVVLLQGRSAQRVWQIVIRMFPAIGSRRLAVIESFHPSNGALRTPDSAERERRREHRAAAWRQAAAVLGSAA